MATTRAKVSARVTARTGTRADGRDYPRIIVPPPGPKAKAIIARDERWTSTSNIKEYPLVVARGSGAMVEDVDGNRFLDFMAGIAVTATGHAHPAVVKAVQDAAARFLHICGGDFYYENLAALSERLAKVAPGHSKKRVFLTNSGTEAVEGAIKLARYSTGRSGIVAFKGAFHGRTYGALSLTSSKVKQHAGFGPFLPDVHHVPYAYCYRCEFGKTFPSCELFCARAIEDDLLARHLSPKDVAAIFVEPVQGEGGYIVPPNGYLKALRELCDRHGILLVFDEIQCGMGRTGKMFAADHFGIEPDILLSAKGLASGMPLGAIIARESIMTWESGSHGSTFGGNPLACTASLAVLKIIDDEKLIQGAHDKGEALQKMLEGLVAELPQICESARGDGLLRGIVMKPGHVAREVLPKILQNGVMLTAAGDRVLRFSPPLVVTIAELEEGVAVVRKVLSELVSKPATNEATARAL